MLTEIVAMEGQEVRPGGRQQCECEDLLGCGRLQIVRQEERVVVYFGRCQHRSDRHLICCDHTSRRATIQLAVPCLVY